MGDGGSAAEKSEGSCDSAPARVLQATALADAYGFPAEGLTPWAIQRQFPGGVRAFALFGRYGASTDDTEQAARTAQAFAVSGGSPEKFTPALARQLRDWLWSVPPVAGGATVRALLRLSFGWGPARAAVCSAGSGPCLRAPVLGALVPRNDALLCSLVDASTGLTHTDARAVEGARLLALWTALAIREGKRPSWDAFRLTARPWLSECSPFHRWLDEVGESVARAEPTSRWAVRFGLDRGVTGYVGHVVPTVLHLVQSVRHSWEGSVRIAVALGGDTDTVAALTGAMMIVLPDSRFPSEWASRHRDWPCSLAWLGAVGRGAQAAAHTGTPQRAVPIRAEWISLPMRNGVLLAMMLGHTTRRLVRTLGWSLGRWARRRSGLPPTQ